MKVVIDARFLGPEGSGLGKYIEKLLENFQKIDEQRQYFVILRKANFIKGPSQKINRVIEDKNFKDKLAKKGEKQVKKYSWRKTAEETLEV